MVNQHIMLCDFWDRIKYTRQGFTICGGGLANMLEQVAAEPSIIRGEVEYVD